MLLQHSWFPYFWHSKNEPIRENSLQSFPDSWEFQISRLLTLCGCNFLSQNVSTFAIRHICGGVLGEHRDVRAEALSRFDDMSSKGFDSGVMGEAKRSLRVGVIGAGVMAATMPACWPVCRIRRWSVSSIAAGAPGPR